VFRVAPPSGLPGVLGARSNRLLVGPLTQLVLRHADCETLEDLPTPLHAVACDMRIGAEARLSQGPLVDGVLASTALPGVFPGRMGPPAPHRRPRHQQAR
jgi:NTE family protein